MKTLYFLFADVMITEIYVVIVNDFFVNNDVEFKNNNNNDNKNDIDVEKKINENEIIQKIREKCDFDAKKIILNYLLN